MFDSVYTQLKIKYLVFQLIHPLGIPVSEVKQTEVSFENDRIRKEHCGYQTQALDDVKREELFLRHLI